MAKPITVNGVAVVIPTLNEADGLARALGSLAEQTKRADRVIVADGGSCDSTLAIADRFGARIVACPTAGRGNQIAFALRDVSEEIVVIGHGDMRFPINAVTAIWQHLSNNPDCPGGCLGHRFDSASWPLRLIELRDAQRARHGVSYGDQAQFFRLRQLESVGGFPDQPLLEDLELSHRLAQLGRPVYLETPVTVSARRFHRLGILRTVWRNWRLRRRYHREGLPACEQLYRLYYG